MEDKAEKTDNEIQKVPKDKDKGKIIGRRREQEILKALLGSKKAEFLAIYGRRRIGKTYLTRVRD